MNCNRAAQAGIFALAALAAGAGPAMAQAYIGEVVGEMVAAEKQAAMEKACREGKPADPDAVKSSTARAEKLMTTYFALTPASSPREIKRLFASDQPDPSWRDNGGKIAITDLAAHLGPPVTTPQLMVAVVAGDNQTMREIWSATRGTDTVYYAVDIVNGDWLSSSRIWHMAVLPVAPETPPAYCHFDPETSF